MRYQTAPMRVKIAVLDYISIILLLSALKLSLVGFEPTLPVISYLLLVHLADSDKLNSVSSCNVRPHHYASSDILATTDLCIIKRLCGIFK